jgi:hypothetical protein
VLKYFNARYDAIIQAASVYHQKNVDNPEKKEESNKHSPKISWIDS